MRQTGKKVAARGAMGVVLVVLALVCLPRQSLAVVLNQADIQDSSVVPGNPSYESGADLAMLVADNADGNDDTNPVYDWDDANETYGPTGRVASGGYVTSWGELIQLYTINSMPSYSDIGIAFNISEPGTSTIYLNDLRVYGIEIDGDGAGADVGLAAADFSTIFGLVYPYGTDLTSDDQDNFALTTANLLRDYANPGGTYYDAYVHELALTPDSALTTPYTLDYGASTGAGPDSIVNTHLNWSSLYTSTFDANDVFLVWAQTSEHAGGSDSMLISGAYIVPEPSAGVLLALGGLALLVRRRGARQS